VRRLLALPSALAVGSGKWYTFRDLSLLGKALL
jgi:hypothetical protein